MENSLPEEKFRKLFRFTLVGQFYSLILPGQITGELAKGYRFAGEGGNDGAKATASIIVDKVTTFGSMVVLGIIGCIFATIRAPFFIVLIILSFSLVLVAFIYASRFSSPFIKILNIFKVPQKILLKLKMFIDYYNSFYLSYRTLIISILVGMISQFLLIWLNIIIMHSIGVSIGLFETLWLFAASSFVTILPITLGGLGIREAVFAASALSLGIRPTIMVTLSLIVYSFQAAFALFGGLLEMWHFFRRNRNSSQLG